MAGIVKTMVRLGVIGTAVGAGAVVVAGPDRVMNMVHQARAHVNEAIDANIDNPIALRNQLRKLEREYPQRIAEVQSELGAVTTQIVQLQDEYERALLKVDLASADLEGIQGLIEQGEQARVENASYSVIKIRFDGQSLDMDGAYAKANRISQLRSAFSSHAADIERDIGILTQQHEQLTTLLDQLQSERAEFQTKLWQTENEIDAIARNDRLIEMLETRQKRLDQFDSPYGGIATVQQLNTKMAEIRSAQEQRLQALAQGAKMDDYDARATYLLEHNEGASKGSFKTDEIEISPSVIEIEPKDDGRVASRR
jgi:chromosome segregation ATPase